MYSFTLQLLLLYPLIHLSVFNFFLRGTQTVFLYQNFRLSDLSCLIVVSSQMTAWGTYFGSCENGIVSGKCDFPIFLHV